MSLANVRGKGRQRFVAPFMRSP